MSKRPRIVSRHEKAVEKEIQNRRAARDGELETDEAPVEVPAPVIESHGRGPLSETPPEVGDWIDEEARAQRSHYERIYREQEALGPQREIWVEEFFARITGPRGFSVHAGMRRSIPEEDLPERPDRPWRVVW